MQNFISTENPFNLAQPPRHFMAAMFDMDSHLVIFPSIEGPTYQVACRLQYTRHVKPSARHPDTKVFAQYNLHPVCRLLPSPYTRWGPKVLQDIRAFDVDAVGGGDKAADILDGFDRESGEKFEVEQEALLDYVTADTWRYLKKRHFDRATTSQGAKASRSVPSIGRLRFKTATGGSAVFVGERHAADPRERLERLRQGRADVPTGPPKIVADVHV